MIDKIKRDDLRRVAEAADATEINRIRGAQVTHCPLGHSYDRENTYRDRAGKRHCKMCMSLRGKARDRNMTPEQRSAKNLRSREAYARRKEAKSK